jgi:hypothetical protein
MMNWAWGVFCLDTLVHVPKDTGYSIETFIDCENFTLIQQPNDDFQVIFFFIKQLIVVCFFLLLLAVLNVVIYIHAVSCSF